MRKQNQYPLFDQPHQLGPAYDPQVDRERLVNQLLAIRDLMLKREWMTLGAIERALGFPQASISAQLRHLRKEACGSHTVDKRRADGKGSWEYRVRR